MKLYDCKTAPSPRRVRIFIAEKGIEIDKIPVDLAGGEQFGDAFRAINPDCVVPVLLLDDGTLVSEVLAICQYLEELYPEPTLFGQTPVEKAVVLSWNAKIEQQGLWGMVEAFRNSAKGLKNHALQGPDQFEQIPELAVRGRERVRIFLGKLNAQLAGNEHVAGDIYSIADISALVLVDFAAWIKIQIPESAANLRRWHEQVSARESAGA